MDAAAGDPRHRGGLPLPLCYAEPVRKPGDGRDGRHQHEQGPDRRLQVAAVRAGSELYRMEYSGGSDAGHSGYLGGAVHRPEQHRLLPGDQKDQGRRLLPAAAGG